ncbi:ABC transporter permease [Atribacter laminatus]|uniref:Ribose import permease protein RbsC n=1 Tax=Atribacter laminatus TaxID=2847778 RepID=A0A7T1F1W7_ATRLM|nr:ABC transporter permease [Atribacter laminatus]QPM67403.1 Ribose import permease protein RbsC [Atribacter laminatus]
MVENENNKDSSFEAVERFSEAGQKGTIKKESVSRKVLVEMFRIREIGVLMALILLLILFSLTSPVFFSVNNLLNVVRQVSLLGIIAMGMTMVIVSGEIDLSVGAVYGLAAVVAGMLMTNGVSIIISIIFALLAGMGFGLINGILVTYARIPALIVTLGTLNVARGAALIASKAQVISTSHRTVADPAINTFLFIGQGKLFEIIPMMSIFLVITAIASYFIFNKTIMGFYMRAVGGNKMAARASGINVMMIKVAAFVITGFFCALAGILNLSFLANVQGTVGYGLELDVIAAVIIGGTSMSGGEGTILGTTIGVLIMGVLRNGLILLGVSPFWQILIIGLVIIGAVGLDTWTSKQKIS